MRCALPTTSASCCTTAFTYCPMGTSLFHPEWCMTRREAEMTEPHGCSQPQRRRTAAFRFPRRTMRRPVRTRMSASVRHEEHASRTCKIVTWSRTSRVPPLHYLRRLLLDSTPRHPKFSSGTSGTTLFKVSTIPPPIMI